MARNPLISAARLALIEERQQEGRWGELYQPSMRATRDEAPTISRPSTVYCPKIGRELHFMSLPEREVCLLALYHPGVFDIHEQHMLSPFPTPHPLAGREDTKGMPLLPFRGTIDVAERCGRLSQHPTVWVLSKAGDDGVQAQQRAAFPYIGDLLLFLRDDQGPYCVNWTVKSDRAAFSKHSETRLLNPQRAKRKEENAKWRHQLEKEYFADAGIKTYQMSAADIDRDVTANLTALAGHTTRPRSLDTAADTLMVQRFKEIIGTSTSPLSLLASMTADFDCPRSHCLDALYRGIWERQLAVDLYRPILIDKPLHSERSDVLVNYAHYFKR